MIEYKFGRVSLARLETVDSRLVRIAKRSIEISPIDFTIVCGWRGELEQNSYADMGASKVRWPQSKHNYVDSMGHACSLAFDFAPWVDGAIPWKDTHLFSMVAGVILAVAKQQKIAVTWGADFDRDQSTTDSTFLDFGHIELLQ